MLRLCAGYLHRRLRGHLRDHKGWHGARGLRAEEGLERQRGRVVHELTSYVNCASSRLAWLVSPRQHRSTGRPEPLGHSGAHTRCRFFFCCGLASPAPCSSSESDSTISTRFGTEAANPICASFARAVAASLCDRGAAPRVAGTASQNCAACAGGTPQPERVAPQSVACVGTQRKPISRQWQDESLECSASC